MALTAFKAVSAIFFFILKKAQPKLRTVKHITPIAAAQIMTNRKIKPKQRMCFYRNKNQNLP